MCSRKIQDELLTEYERYIAKLFGNELKREEGIKEDISKNFNSFTSEKVKKLLGLAVVQDMIYNNERIKKHFKNSSYIDFWLVFKNRLKGEKVVISDETATDFIKNTELTKEKRDQAKTVMTQSLQTAESTTPVSSTTGFQHFSIHLDQSLIASGFRQKESLSKEIENLKGKVTRYLDTIFDTSVNLNVLVGKVIQVLCLAAKYLRNDSFTEIHDGIVEYDKTSENTPETIEKFTEKLRNLFDLVIDFLVAEDNKALKKELNKSNFGFKF